MSLFTKFQQRFSQFMIGRYGIDSFSRTITGTAIGLYLINIFIGSSIIYYMTTALLIYAYFRMFSRNIYKRAQENQLYLTKTVGIRNRVNRMIREFQSKKTHHIYKCPSCKQKIRVPRGKGRISIHCPKCQLDFIKNS